MENKLVSVIVPVYNSERYLRQCLDSLINQTYPHLEIIIIDDFSQDTSLTIAKEYAKNDNRFVVVSSSNNNGYLLSTNHGFSLATGDFITFLDSDDTCSLQRIENQLKYLEEKNLDLVGSYCKIVDHKNSIIQHIKYPSYLKSKTIENIRACGSSVLLRRHVLTTIGKFNPLFSRIGSEDFEWLMRASKLFKYATIPEYLYNYRKADGNITTDLNSPYANKRAISHIIASKLVLEKHKITDNEYWTNDDVIKRFNELMDEALEDERIYPINSIHRDITTHLYCARYSVAIEECIKFTLKHKYHKSSYIILLKTLIKSIIYRMR
ncbi:glycosyltransferase family 2 protein [Providencia alcalifaciens]|uniref:glycosyltransferase family 2 protein n=1 Tax=Providencia alcalifaciens TaxID=126385 RepID=UPI0003E2510F|nr:glycosyltransferase family 2 protein [Providencia alcalifaciens]ETT01320.1 glycosyltransferase-like protein, family 2 [Providencia alcalifaciens PAL-3]EUC98987.1 glycosyltransferase-like protein, family 2 [Providencia alcalifaciens PAL-1]